MKSRFLQFRLQLPNPEHIQEGGSEFVSADEVEDELHRAVAVVYHEDADVEESDAGTVIERPGDDQSEVATEEIKLLRDACDEEIHAHQD